MLSAPPVRRATWLLATIGAIAARLLAAPDGAAKPKAMVSRSCAYQDTPAVGAPAGDLRAAVVCLMNLARHRAHLPAIREQHQLTDVAQSHSDQMVAGGFFSHTNPDGSQPWDRVGRAGFRWSAVGETISTGFATPASAVSGWLASTEHCRILLSPSYRDVGIGVAPRPVRGYATGPATWTADFALAAGSGAPSNNWGPANGCPY